MEDSMKAKHLRMMMIRKKKPKTKKQLNDVKDIDMCEKLEYCTYRKTNIIKEDYEPSEFEKKVLGLK